MLVVGSRTFKTVNHLEELVVYAATEYELNGYVEDSEGSEITDAEYDALVKMLKQHNPASKAFKGTSPSKVKTKGKIVVHVPPMTSINKADGDDKQSIYEKWKQDCEQLAGNKLTFTQSYKHDGVAIRVNYVNGNLASAGLRPRDGINGSDVTHHMKYIQGIPQILPMSLTLSLNGEIECHLSDFEKLNKKRDENGEETYKNPRNYTAGCLGRDDAEENKDSQLKVAFYSITGFVDWRKYYNTEIERAKWANIKLELNGSFVRVMPHHDYKQLESMEENAKKLDYYTDGVVLKVNELSEQEELGHHGDDPIKEPRGALAWKYAEETAQAEVSSIQWNASRTGRVVPTAIFDTPFVLADTENRKATCNNYGWMEVQGLGPGAVVQCKKGGKIIPNIMKVLKKAKSMDAPTHCPTCSSQLRINVSDSGNKDLQCVNHNCAARHVKGWIFYLQMLGCKGLGSAAMEQILQSGKVKALPDIYDLEVSSLTPHGFSERQALLALATIHQVEPIDDNDSLLKKINSARKKPQVVQAWQFFAALGIPGAGKTAGKALVSHFKDFAKIQQATEEELLKIDGIGDATAKAIVEWFNKNNAMVRNLLTKVELELPKSGKLTGKNFVLTGAFEGGKETYHKMIEELGGVIQGSVGSKTSYLVAGEKVGKGKTDKANQYGIPIITVNDLEKML